MPATKRLEDRAFMQKPEPEPEKFTVLEHFDRSQTFVYNLLLPESLHKMLSRIQDKSTFVNEAMLSLINDCKGVVSTEARMPRSDWYVKTREIPGKARILFEGRREKVTPKVKVQGSITRKFIKLPDTATVPLYANSTKYITSVNAITKLWNEFYRLSEYHQMTVEDALLQAMERALERYEDAQAKAAINPNVARLSATAARWISKSDLQAERTAEMVAKRAAKQADNQESK